MTKVVNNLNVVLDTLPERLQFARSEFESLTTCPAWRPIVRQWLSWGIVGGAVRDVLWSTAPGTIPMFRRWQDLDVALIRPVSEYLLDEKFGIRHENLTINSFGGIRVHDSVLGPLDLWSWATKARGRLSTDTHWWDLLEATDFGINAVAFLLPDCRIVVHPRWVEDLRHRRVEQLAADSPRHELQSLRAIALLTKAELQLGGRFRLGVKCSADLKWFVQDAEEADVRCGVEYLIDKTSTLRWSPRTLTVFLREAGKYEWSKVFRSALQEATNVKQDQLPTEMLARSTPRSSQGRLPV